MTPKRLVLAIIVVFVAVLLSHFLIHSLWLANTYWATKDLGRPETDFPKYMGWLMAGQFLTALTFVVIWSKGFPATASLGGSCMYGLFMGLFSEATTLAPYAVQPLPAELAAKWFISG